MTTTPQPDLREYLAEALRDLRDANRCHPYNRKAEQARALAKINRARAAIARAEGR